MHNRHRSHDIDYKSLTAKELERHSRVVPPGGQAIDRHRPLATLLGSCVAVCFFDPLVRIGGINHFMLPSVARDRQDDVDVLLGGDYAMEALLNAMLAMGAQKRRIQAKAFGGGDILGSDLKTTVGSANAEFAKEWLKTEGIPLLAADLEGPWSRKVVFLPSTGEAYCRRLVSERAVAARIAREEEAYERSLQRQPKHTDIELF